jgi:hypothetical protein
MTADDDPLRPDDERLADDEGAHLAEDTGVASRGRTTTSLSIREAASSGSRPARLTDRRGRRHSRRG